MVNEIIEFSILSGYTLRKNIKLTGARGYEIYTWS